MLSKQKIEDTNAIRLSQVKPELAKKCRTIIQLAANDGFTLIVTQGFRTHAEQDKLFQIGRRGIAGERKVTNARGGQSKHNHRTAVDFAFVVDGEISWDEKLYQNIGRWAKQVGLSWGENWKSFKDPPHVEL